MRVCDAAVLVLRETNNPAVMHGDSGLLHLIADRAQLQLRDRAWKTEEAVLKALSAQPGELIPAFTRSIHWNRRIRIFYLREHAPAWALEAARQAKTEA